MLTDTGYVPERVRPELESSDLIVIEANHEVNMLKAGPYPYRLKLRILGDSGHLSNETAGEILSDVMSRDDRYRTILLAHLSRENNFPQLALQTVTNILEDVYKRQSPYDYLSYFVHLPRALFVSDRIPALRPSLRH